MPSRGGRCVKNPLKGERRYRQQTDGAYQESCHTSSSLQERAQRLSYLHQRRCHWISPMSKVVVIPRSKGMAIPGVVTIEPESRPNMSPKAMVPVMAAVTMVLVGEMMATMAVAMVAARRHGVSLDARTKQRRRGGDCVLPQHQHEPHNHRSQCLLHTYHRTPPPLPEDGCASMHHRAMPPWPLLQHQTLPTSFGCGERELDLKGVLGHCQRLIPLYASSTRTSELSRPCNAVT